MKDIKKVLILYAVIILLGSTANWTGQVPSAPILKKSHRIDHIWSASYGILSLTEEPMAAFGRSDG